MAALALLLLSIGALFFPSTAQEAYSTLPEAYKKGVDLALEKVNSHPAVQHHFLFFKSVTKSDIEFGFIFEWNTRTTACSNWSMLFCVCALMQPLVDCAVCYKTFQGEIEQEPKPYVHCIHRPALTEVSLCLT
uniref:Uncharacterized protein n=1 Tax=Monopterus albus TaxID=43700 RepID=A0A3Q3IMZ6_MONAL